MLVLVGVTINVALTGGLFEKGEKAAYQTNASTIKEQVALKKAEVLAEHNGKSQDDYKITMSSLELTGNLKEFETKLTISKDGTLYYIEEAVNEKEKAWLEEIGIGKGSAIIGKTPLTQMKNGDVWNNVTFYSETISNKQPVFAKKGIKAIKDENGNYIPELDENGDYIDVELSSNSENIAYGVGLGGVNHGMVIGGLFPSNVVLFMETKVYITGFGEKGDVTYGDLELDPGQIYEVDNVEIGTPKPINKEEIELINFSGIITCSMSYMENGDVINAIIPIPQEIKNWFSGDVTYVEDDIYFE